MNPEKPSYALSSEGVSINHGSSSVIETDRGKTLNAVESSGVSVSGLSADQQVTRSDRSPKNKLARSRNPNLTLPTATAVDDAAKTGIGPINIITYNRAGRASREPDTNASNIASDDTDRCTIAARDLGNIDVTDINKVEQSDKKMPTNSIMMLVFRIICAWQIMIKVHLSYRMTTLQTYSITHIVNERVCTCVTCLPRKRSDSICARPLSIRTFRNEKDRKTHQFFVLLPKNETESQMSHQYLQFVSND